MGTMQGSGAISLGQVQNNFGGGAPTNFSEYYRGLGIPQGPPVNNQVPTGGQISLSQLYNTTTVAPMPSVTKTFGVIHSQMGDGMGGIIDGYGSDWNNYWGLALSGSWMSPDWYFTSNRQHQIFGIVNSGTRTGIAMTFASQSDAVFHSIIINGVTFLRSSAVYGYTGGTGYNGGHWTWDDYTPGAGASIGLVGIGNAATVVIQWV
jgi:hypothetical protein